MLRSILCFFVAFSITAAWSAVICAGAATRSIHVEWGYTPPSKPAVTGYKLYQEGAFACKTLQPAATSMDCTVSLTKATTQFTLTALFKDGTESPHSSPFAFSTAAQNAPAATTPAAAVISSSVAAGTSPLLVAFDGSASTAANKGPIVAYGWTFGDGAAAAGAWTTHTFAAAGTYVATLTITDSKGNQSRATTPIVVTKTTTAVVKSATTANQTASSANTSAASSAGSNAQAAALQLAAQKSALNLEAGEVSIADAWVRVVFTNRYTNPIVTAGPPRYNNSAPCMVRIRNVNATGFEVRLAEWLYQDGHHPAETIGYLVMEKGRTQLADGSWIEAGSFIGTTWTEPVAFGGAMNKIPVVLTSIVSVNDADTVAGRVNAVGRSGFSYAFREQEKSLRYKHANETVHYVAWEPGKGVIGGVEFEAAAGPTVTSFWSAVRFQSAFKQQPMVLADLQTNANSDTAVLRLQQQTAVTGFSVKVEEEQSLDLETAHPAEQVGYLALAQPQGSRQAAFSWEFDEELETGVAGFEILSNGQPVCAVNNAAARQLTCVIPQPVQPTAFSVKAIGRLESATALSNTILYTP